MDGRLRRRCLQLLRCAGRARVPVVALSRSELLLPRLARPGTGWYQAALDTCQFGSRLRRRVVLASLWTRQPRELARCCTGSDFKCSESGRAHLPRSLVSRRLPARLGHALARLLVDAMRDLRMARLQQLLNSGAAYGQIQFAHKGYR